MLIAYFRYHVTEYCAVIVTHSTVRGNKLLYGHVPAPFPRCATWDYPLSTSVYRSSLLLLYAAWEATNICLMHPFELVMQKHVFFLHVRHTTAFSWPVWSFCFVQYIRPPHFNSYLWEFLFVVVVVVVGSICVLFVINVSRKLPWGPNSAFKPTYNTDRMVLCENLGLKACEWMCAVKVWSLSMSEESCLGLDYSCTCKWGAVAEASKATLEVGTDFYVRLYCPRLRMSKNSHLQN